MSGIFNLFSGTGDSAKHQFSSGNTDALKKSSLTSMNLGNVANVSGKNVGLSRPKPKGLSVRPKSDLNVTNLNINAGRSPTKKSPVKKKTFKLEIGPFGSVPRQLSPRGREKISKLQTINSKQLKASSSKPKLPDNMLSIGKMPAEASVFRKPFTPKINRKPVKVYPTPEKLAYYHDEENDLNSMALTLDQDFIRAVRLHKTDVKPYEDEGFHSDPELISQPCYEKPIVSFEDHIPSKTPSLPSLSDDDDFFD